MAELSNAVTVLIARMESHPEDFETWGPSTRPKFADEAKALYGLAGLDEEMKNAYWYLSDADKEALIAAWKKFHLTKFEKNVMETIFDDGHEERERELEKLKQKVMMQNAMMKQQVYQQQAHLPQPVTGLNAAQGSGNAGLFGMAGDAWRGLIR